MFDATTAQLLRSAPDVPGLDAENIPALLTEHYANLVSSRLRGGPRDPDNADDPWPPQRIADTYELLASLLTDRVLRSASAFVAATAQQIVARQESRQSDDAPPPNVDRNRVDPTIAAA